jgi:recombinational DNA repair protein (RecF pathway)
MVVHNLYCLPLAQRLKQGSTCKRPRAGGHASNRRLSSCNACNASSNLFRGHLTQSAILSSPCGCHLTQSAIPRNGQLHWWRIEILSRRLQDRYCREHQVAEELRAQPEVLRWMKNAEQRLRDKDAVACSVRSTEKCAQNCSK